MPGTLLQAKDRMHNEMMGGVEWDHLTQPAIRLKKVKRQHALHTTSLGEKARLSHVTGKAMAKSYAANQLEYLNTQLVPEYHTCDNSN